MNIFQLRKISNINFNNMKHWKQHACFYCVVVGCRGGSCRREGISPLAVLEVACVGSPVSVMEGPACMPSPYVGRLVVMLLFLFIWFFCMWLLFRCVIVFYPSLVKFEVVDVRVHSEFIYLGKYPFKIFSYTRSCMKIFCTQKNCM